MDDEEIDVVNYETKPIVEKEHPQIKDIFQCDLCDYSGRNQRSFNAHRKHKHFFEDENLKKVKPCSQKESNTEECHDQEYLPRVTTKQLLGGRKRPRTVVEDTSDERKNHVNEDEMDAEMPVGEYVALHTNSVYKSRRAPFPILENSDFVTGEELEVVEEEEVISSVEKPSNSYSPHATYSRRNPNSFVKKYISGGKIPNKLLEGDGTGKYKCYIEDCHWRCSYRSLRMEHMKALHPEWKMPPRYILERISKDGVYLNPDEYVPPIACTVSGCDWRGNYRASRSAHMRKVHPVEHAESKKKLPGYNSEGTYGCHFPMCTWRGFSRSTRSNHLKKAHPQWRSEDGRSTPLLTCFHCKASFPSYPLLLNHIDKQHDGCGMHVDEIFHSRDTFGIWLQRVEREYSITFERCDPVAPSADENIYTLRCSCIGDKGIQLAAESRNYIYQKHNFLKRRQHQFLTRSKNDCSVHLEIREDPVYGITVKGSLEHTGHRFGTPLLRLSSSDRLLYSNMMNSKMDAVSPLMALEIVEKLNAFEGFTMENYGPEKTRQIIKSCHESSLISFRTMIEEQFDRTCLFAVDFSNLTEHKFSFGYMSHEMQQIWMSPRRVVTVDVTSAEFEEIETYVYSVIVHTDDNKFIPRCVLVYLTTNQEDAPRIVLEQLKEIDPRPPNELLCDPSQIWPETVAKIWPGSHTDVLISEWSLMEFWAAKVEEFVRNELDIFSIVSALRRLLRCDDVHQVLFFIIELFESLYECGYSSLADFFDSQFSDLEYFKRWSPTHRYDHNSHSLPTLAVSSRTLRGLYLNSEDFDRIDEWFNIVIRRIEDFNIVDETQTYTLRAIDFRGRKYFYNAIQELHKQDTMLVYAEELIDGEVVEEEVIGHEVVGEDIMEEVVVDEEEEVGEGVMVEEIVEEEEILYHDDMIMKEDPEQDASCVHLYQKEDIANSSGTMSRGSHLPQIITSTSIRKKSPPKRDTTKQVVRGRKKKDRFAELRDCPPEVMRAMAAYAICHDGRKKQQHPFTYIPSKARMAQSTEPSVATPASEPFRQFITAVPHRRMNREMVVHNREKQLEREHHEYLQQFDKHRMIEEESSSAHHHYHHISEHHHHDNPEDAAMILVDEEMEIEDDDDQPCTSSSLY